MVSVVKMFWMMRISVEMMFVADVDDDGWKRKEGGNK